MWWDPVSARRGFEQLAQSLEGDWRSLARTTLDLAADKMKVTIDEVVAEMFAKYPTRVRK